MKKILAVFGTRPEAIKMCPLVNVLRSQPDRFAVSVCVTGQHRQMLDSVLSVFGITPDYDLSIMKPGQTLFDITSDVLLGMKDVIEDYGPDVVLVHGDTTTSFSAALASFYLHVPVGHVEAGLRTYDIESPFPEEFNRQAVDLITTYYFAPTQNARENLVKEGKDPSKVYVTGNTGIDALATTVKDDFTHSVLDWVGDSRLILLTAHRRESLGDPMHHMFRAIRRITEDHPDVKVLYPVHLNPAVRRIAKEELAGNDRIRLIDPLDVIDFHNIMKSAHIILTDSGGIQEEAPSLGKPVLVMRDTTERPEGVVAGTLKIVGTQEDKIFEECNALLESPEAYRAMSQASNPYGDGHASERIASVLSEN
ncbi:non-hydrolyzing UDP-N-acetylglucosamine 2-epimerase [Granulimonas faecalis]|uniref:non-hydrolyzing UDP-N-acetylglucosamine 2-epimerase n=1 Tax=Granulimonas faecalis TaxID=2894155 RepID=UPI003518C023